MLIYHKTAKMVYKRRFKVLPIPDIWYDSREHKYLTQERGEKCYVIRALDNYTWQYRVMKRVVKDSPSGFIETLNGQIYQRFKTMDEAVDHFHKHEEGQEPLMLPVKITDK